MLEEMPPWMGGGEMIDRVTLQSASYAPPPLRFEAGTPAIGEVIGLGAAVDYLTRIGMDRIQVMLDATPFLTCRSTVDS